MRNRVLIVSSILVFQFTFIQPMASAKEQKYTCPHAVDITQSKISHRGLEFNTSGAKVSFLNAILVAKNKLVCTYKLSERNTKHKEPSHITITWIADIPNYWKYNCKFVPGADSCTNTNSSECVLRCTKKTRALHAPTHDEAEPPHQSSNS